MIILFVCLDLTDSREELIFLTDLPASADISFKSTTHTHTHVTFIKYQIMAPTENKGFNMNYTRKQSRGGKSSAFDWKRIINVLLQDLSDFAHQNYYYSRKVS